LKDALTRQFGAAARGIVEAEVDAHLSGGTVKLQREDLDAIERNVLTAMKQRRTGTLGGSSGLTRGRMGAMSRSAPNLDITSNSAAASSMATAPAAAPRGMVATPFPKAQPSTLTRVASTGSVPAPAPKGKARTGRAPFAVAIGDDGRFEPDLPSARVKVEPKYPVPLPPKLKPMDHWDLIVAFDSAKHQQEKKMVHEAGKAAKKEKFKATLDGQMDEIREIQAREADERTQERDLMLAQVEENKRHDAAEEEKRHTKKLNQLKSNTDMLEILGRQKRKDDAKKQREADLLTQYLENEKYQAEQDAIARRHDYAKRCAAAQEELQADRKMREERKLAEWEEDKRLMKLRQEMMDEAEAKNAKAVQDRKDRIEAVGRTLGAAVADRDAQLEAELEARVKRVQEESNRAAEEASRKKMESHQRKVTEMLEVRAKQVEEFHRRGEDDKEASRKQLEIFKQQLLESNEQERQKVEKRRKAREDLDISLIEKQRINAGIHPQHIMMTPRNKKTELSYNKVLFEQMKAETFQMDAVDTLLMNAQDKGKLLSMGSVAPYNDAIHPLEMEAPDVS